MSLIQVDEMAKDIISITTTKMSVSYLDLHLEMTVRAG